MLEHTDYTDALRKEVIETVSRIPIEYNPKGWEKLSKQLDVELPVSKGGQTGFRISGKWIRFSVLFTIALLVLSVAQGSEPVSVSVSSMEQKNAERKTEEEKAAGNLTRANTTKDGPPTNSSETAPSFQPVDEKLNSRVQDNSSIFNHSETQHSKTTPATRVDTNAYIPKTEQKEDSVFIFW